MIKLAAIFKNHMVLQREKRIAFWGESDESLVAISFLGKTLETKTKNGKWEITFPPQKAGGPYEIVIHSNNDQIRIEDVYIGEVWLAGGQSNMEFELHKSNGGQELLESAKAFLRANRAGQTATDSRGLVRFYQVSRISFIGEELEKAEKENEWQVYGADTMDNWSAVGFYFAKELATKLAVMVGIIGCNWGGTSASCWMSPKKLKSKSETIDYMTEYEEATKDQVFEKYLEELAAYKAYQSVFDKNVAEYYQTAENPTWDEAIELFGENMYPGPMGPRSERRPGGLYEVMLSRVMPYSLRGFLYYQGEEDDHRPYSYEAALESVISQWRSDWKDDEIPFYYVMLPMFADIGAPDYKNWAFLREAQININKRIKNTGMANPFELGEYGNIHPTDKEPVGKRLANLALGQVYAFSELEASCNGPRYKDFYVDGKQMHLKFINMESGLLIRKNNKLVELQEEIEAGFELAAEDGKYLPAIAVVKNGEIILESSAIEEPMYARYLWTNYADVLLFGRNGIPMEPFRTSKSDGAKATGSRQGYIITEDLTRVENSKA